MFTAKKEITQVSGSDSKILLAGVVLGALVGLGAAYLITNRVEEDGQPLKISSGEGIKLGVLVLGLLRQIASL